MQCLTRNVVFNLTKNAANVRPVVVGIQNQHKNYSTARAAQKLLKFPVFPLEETITKFLKTTEPLLDKNEFNETKKAADEFLCGDGAKLQKLLVEASKKSENWLADRWLRTAYLQYRDPVCVYSSPGMTFPYKKFCSDEDYLRYTAEVIFGTLKYKETIDQNKIPVHKIGENELDNSQFSKVFGTCRVPGMPEDSLEYNPQSKHIVVIYKNHFYKLPVYTKDCKILHPDVIFEQLSTIHCAEKTKGVDFGILTTDNRDNWAKAYKELLAIEGNCSLVAEIRKSLFTVSLDQEVPVEPGCNENEVVSEQLIHGGGSCQNAGNRWMDKTIQVIVNRNGVNGFCYEHSPAEGQPIALMDDYIVGTLGNKDLWCDASKCDYESATKLKLSTSSDLDCMINTAKENVDKLSSNLHMKVLHYKGFGKEFLKTQKLSPDSFIQMAMQYAFYKLHKTPGAAYESAHLRIYANGRTETIRSCSNESIAFSKSMMDNCIADDVRVKLLRDAVQGHRQYTTMALQGRGVDRHLLGLKLMALENKLPIPEFYKSPGIGKSTHFRLSTSQVASANEAFMCYGPYVDNGYGCCYNPRKNDMFFAISSWKSNKETSSETFAISMREALDNMMKLLNAAGEKPKAKL